MKTLKLAAASLLAATTMSTAAFARDQIQIAGSSTVLPYASIVAEAFGENFEFPTPVVESGGSGAGRKKLCEGVGENTIDIANSSSRIKQSDIDLCASNGVNEIQEVRIGYDGIVFATDIAGPDFAVEPVDVYKALASNPYGEPNTAKTWQDVNAALPAIPILVYGPPSTSGTRDALAELILEAGCKSNPEMKALKETDEDKYKAICTQVREDGAYVDSGENDNLIVQKIAQNPKAIGVFGYSFLEENTDKLKGIPMSDVEPTYATISDFSYPGARPLYIYVKKAHVGVIKGLSEYVAEWAQAWGADGYLKGKGMVVSPEEVRTRNAEVAKNMTPLDPAELK